MKRFLVMLTFLTRIPVPINFDVTYDDYVKGVQYVPFIALIIGLPLYFLDMLDGLVQPYILSFIVLFVYVFITGGIHIDGMADTFDALGSNRDRERMMEIMSDPRMGTFGTLSIVLYCIGMIVLMPFVPRASLVLFPLVGKGCSLLCAATHNYAKEKGLGKSYMDGSKGWLILLSLILYIGLYYVLAGEFNSDIFLIAIVPLICTAFAVWLMVHRISEKLKGITGDVIGFSVEMSQLLYVVLTYLLTAIMGVQ